MNKKRPAVFLDRDGTLIVEVGYLKDVNELKVIDKVAEAVKKLNDSDILAILVTNQSGVARGYFDENNIKALNQRLADILKEKNAHIDGFYYCPHHPKGIIKEYAKNCACRKPQTGMIEQSFNDFKDIDPSKSYVIGDKVCDIELAKNAGLKGILVKTGYGSEILQNKPANFIEPDYIAEDMTDAVNWICQDIKNLSDNQKYL